MLDTEMKDRYLTTGWINTLIAVLGLPALAYALVVLSTSVLSDRAAFVGMVAPRRAVLPRTSGPRRQFQAAAR